MSGLTDQNRGGSRVVNSVNRNSKISEADYNLPRNFYALLTILIMDFSFLTITKNPTTELPGCIAD